MKISEVFSELALNKGRKWYFNKYLILGCIFTFWITFMDKNNYGVQKRLSKSIHSLEDEKIAYQNKYHQALEDKQELENNPEKYARDNYFMHRDNEQVFYIKGKEK